MVLKLKTAGVVRNALLVLTRPQSSSRNARAREQSLSLAFLLPITPRAPLGRDSEKRLGASQLLVRKLFQREDKSTSRNKLLVALSSQRRYNQHGKDREMRTLGGNDTILLSLILHV